MLTENVLQVNVGDRSKLQREYFTTQTELYRMICLDI